jgi:hypothetical protein
MLIYELRIINVQKVFFSCKFILENFDCPDGGIGRPACRQAGTLGSGEKNCLLYMQLAV